MKKYKTHLLLKEIGQVGQEKIIKAKILVIGLGGIGNPLVRYLAASGVGNLGLIDDDYIEIDNLPRQNNFTISDIDKLKTEITAELLTKLNSELKLDIFSQRANRTLLTKIINNYQIIIDASDNFQTKFLLNDLAHKHKKIFISGSFLGFNGYLAVYKSGIDQSKACFRCFHHKNINQLENRACFKQGVFAPAVGVIGNFMAVEALKEVIGLNSSAGKLMIMNFLTNNHHMANLEKNPHCSCN